MDKKAMTEHIKINLPLTEQDYEGGNGEGVWVLVDPETKRAYDEDDSGEGYIGILDNDSYYYPGLYAGELIPFEMRGECRPVTDFHRFLAQLPRLTPDAKAALVQKIIEYQSNVPANEPYGVKRELSKQSSLAYILE